MTDKYKIIHGNNPPSEEEMGAFKDFNKIESKIVSKPFYFTKSIALKGVAAIVISGAIGFYLISNFTTQEVSEVKSAEIPMEESALVTEIFEKDADKPTEADDIVKHIASSKKESAVKPTFQKKQTTAHVKEQVKKATSDKSSTQEKPQVSITNRFTDAAPIAGFDSLYHYFKESLIYPVEHISDSIEGVVEIQFEVNKLGEIIAPVIIHSLGERFDKEALRVIKNMPGWKPAMVNETPLSIKKQIAIQFKKQN